MSTRIQIIDEAIEKLSNFEAQVALCEMSENNQTDTRTLNSLLAQLKRLIDSIESTQAVGHVGVV